jgi:hypothetical protein
MLRPTEIDDITWEVLTAANSGDVDAMRRLLADDPDRSRNGYFYTPPIHFAVREGHLEIVRMLLDAGADSEWNGHYGSSLIDLAKERGHDAVAALLEDTRTRRGRTPPSETREDHPIHIAAQAGDVRRVRELLDADHSLVNRGDRAGGTPLHRATAGSAREVIYAAARTRRRYPCDPWRGTGSFLGVRHTRCPGHRYCAVGRIRKKTAASTVANPAWNPSVLALAPVEK